MSAAAVTVLVVGLGNPARGDDGVGRRVAERLAGRRLPAGVAVVDRSGDVLSLIDEWAGYDALIVIDASAATGHAGRIERFDLAVHSLSPEVGITSSHAFGLPEAVEVARALGSAPPVIIVYAIEGDDFAAGAPLTPAVVEAAERVSLAVMGEVTALQKSGSEVGVHA